MPRYLTVLSILVWQASLNGAQVTSAPIDQGRLGAPSRVGAKEARIETMLAIHSETSLAY
jgi:hypothetical protein